MDEIFHYSMTQKYLDGNKCRKQIYICRKLYLLGSKDHDVSWTLCRRNNVFLDKIVNHRYCKLYSLFFATGDVGCSLSALRWMNMIFLYLTAFSVYQIIRLLHPTNVFGNAMFLFTEASEVIFMDGSSDVGPYYSRCVFPILHGWSIAVFCIYVHIVCNTKWSRYFSMFVFIEGNKYQYVVLSALFSFFAVFCRQTNIILSVLNPALILLLRVCFFYLWFLFL